MTRDNLLKFHGTLCGEAKDLMSLKNRDYAGKDGIEPFANFTRVEAMGICKTEAGFMVRLTDKMSRLSSFLQSGKMNVTDESFRDTCVDVINYMVLLSAYVKDKEEKITNNIDLQTNADMLMSENNQMLERVQELEKKSYNTHGC